MKRAIAPIIKTISVLLFVTVILLGSSCKKYTDVPRVDALPSAVTFTSAANVELAAAGMYNTASVGTYNNASPGRGYAFGAASIEQGEMRGEDMVNLAAFYQITYQATYDATTANNVNMWLNLYQLINQCNTFIDGVHTAATANIITSGAAAVYEGEARFLRALAHHELLIHFCRPYLDNAGANPGIPYRTIAVNTQAAVAEATLVDRGTVKDCYTKLLADLDYAEANLPATRPAGGTYAAFPISRAEQGAAIALKTRIKLHMGDWAGVIAEGAKLGTGAATGPYISPIGGYKLTATPDAPFTSTGAANTEAVFYIENSSKANGGVNGALPAMLGPADKGGRGLVATSPNLYNAAFWVNSDTRRTLLQVQQSTAGAKYFFNYKYRDYANLTDWAPIIRYAEVLLNVAEAYARTTALDPRALGLLNAVRNRAVAVADQYTIAGFATGDALTVSILNERRIEFTGEGRRWADITRLAMDPNPAFVVGSAPGIPAKVLVGSLAGDGSNYDIVARPAIPATFAAIPYSSFKFLWPIPNTELAANPTLAKAQNPGY